SIDEAVRYVYTTQGVCPPEIHFRIQEEVLKEVRFVGGGCPGNAQLVTRLLQGRPIEDVLELLKEIDCRNGTSCPDQLSRGLISTMDGTLVPAESFNVYEYAEPRRRIGLIGNLEGRSKILHRLIPEIKRNGVEIIQCLGNLTGNSLNNKELIKQIRKEGLSAIQGELDFKYANEREPDSFPSLEQKERDCLVQLPQVISFQVGERSGVAFYGDYLQGLPGFSDFEPFALEMNMVCELTQFMQDESVFPALEAMAPQFRSSVILFGQTERWGHWRVGETDFIGVGPVFADAELAWGLLEGSGNEIRFKVNRIPYSEGETDGGEGYC
ncbi:MAG: TIGR03905 family TSCPD domain-containing protein, partial [Desulfatiglandaceae bacterium]